MGDICIFKVWNSRYVYLQYSPKALECRQEEKGENSVNMGEGTTARRLQRYLLTETTAAEKKS